MASPCTFAHHVTVFTGELDPDLSRLSRVGLRCCIFPTVVYSLAKQTVIL